eukprot:TRINITY_DN2993_c1_g1_i1.p1 TRINITY_DN2993_c1_g1~~TRINITY_DN2993_c1_g1_i1.p1  ORF type:complete len:536 (+),score=106.10 TRINITY_DN2993_c1_g1_i1:116-1723(+)
MERTHSEVKFKLPKLVREVSLKDEAGVLKIISRSSVDQLSMEGSQPVTPQSSTRSRRVRIAPQLDPLQSPFHGAQRSPGEGEDLASTPALPLKARRIKTCPSHLMLKSLAGLAGSEVDSIDSPDGLQSVKSCQHGQEKRRNGRRHKERAETTKACCSRHTGGFGLAFSTSAAEEAPPAATVAPAPRRRCSSSSTVGTSFGGGYAKALNKPVAQTHFLAEKPALQAEPSSVTPSTAASSPAVSVATPLKDSVRDLSSIKTWRCGSKIGQGSYGCVYKGLEMSAGVIFAVKKAMLRQNDDEDHKFVEKLGDELEIFRHLRHPNIVSFLGYEIKDGELCIFMDYVPGGSLSAMLSEFGPLDGKLLRSATMGMLQGLDYLHSRNPPVVHRDIKSANVLVEKDFSIKLSDFGCSKRCELTTSFTTIGSIPWMAPEVIQQQNGYGRKADIWSLGCTILELLTAETPWGKNAFDNVMFALRRIGMSEETPPVPEGAPPDVQDIVRACLQRDAEARPGAADLLSHSYFLGKVCGKNSRRPTKS